jgi:hypothetical protein
LGNYYQLKGFFKMKTKFKYIVLGSLLFGLSGFNNARAITVPELIEALLQFKAEVLQSFVEVNETLDVHETRISDNEAKVTALENADVATDARIAALEAQPKANIEVTAPTPFDDINAGFTEGSVWVDMADRNAYILVDSVAGAALWKQITNIVYNIGDTGPAGGIVFYVTSGGRHGLEAAPEDLNDAEWGCYGKLIPGASRTVIGTGFLNTADIVAGCIDFEMAAALADNYRLNGFDDWFLPSKDELNELYLNKAVVGGFANSRYWSSSEIALDLAWSQSFELGYQYLWDKSYSTKVRAVRAF